MELKLDSKRIFELGESLSNTLRENGIEQISELIIYVTKNELRKIDEDLFYRREHDKDEEFIPSDEEIIINFDQAKIKIKAKELTVTKEESGETEATTAIENTNEE